MTFSFVVGWLKTPRRKDGRTSRVVTAKSGYGQHGPAMPGWCGQAVDRAARPAAMASWIEQTATGGAQKIRWRLPAGELPTVYSTTSNGQSK